MIVQQHHVRKLLCYSQCEQMQFIIWSGFLGILCRHFLNQQRFDDLLWMHGKKNWIVNKPSITVNLHSKSTQTHLIFFSEWLSSLVEPYLTYCRQIRRQDFLVNNTVETLELWWATVCWSELELKMSCFSHVLGPMEYKWEINPYLHWFYIIVRVSPRWI